MNNYINIYTDGSCFNNGKKNATGAIGVFFGDDDERNISLAITDTDTKITNQTMELLACINALDKLNASEKAYIYTDSTYVINCMTSWIKNWEQNNWKTTANKDVENIDLIKLLYQKSKNNLVIFKHINSHTIEPSKDSSKYCHWYGNNKADRLAVNANLLNVKEIENKKIEDSLNEIINSTDKKKKRISRKKINEI
jgi:ribonuclease HI